MGAVPKKQPSDARKNRRYSSHVRKQIKAQLTNLVVCSNCGSRTLPHRVCTVCGQYKGATIVAPKTRVKRVSSN
ncbi:50S ribosomal protein L32 [candidate division WWE3 bacterium]|nr:50S ribosomal protein L32 [candidate division WWE3 bacterium]